MKHRYIVLALCLCSAWWYHASWRPAYAVEGEVDVTERDVGKERETGELKGPEGVIPPEVIAQQQAQQQQAGQEGVEAQPVIISEQGEQPGTGGFTTGAPAKPEKIKTPKDDTSGQAEGEAGEELTPVEVTAAEAAEDITQGTGTGWPSKYTPDDIKLRAFVAQIRARAQFDYNEVVEKAWAQKVLESSPSEQELIDRMQSALKLTDKLQTFYNLATQYYWREYAYATRIPIDKLRPEIDNLMKTGSLYG